MIDWNVFTGDIQSGRMMIYTITGKYWSSDWQTPELALLKALACQWGVEVEE